MSRPTLSIGLLALLAVCAALYFWLFHTYEAPAVDPAWAVEESSEIPPGAVTVRFTGCSTLVFSDGERTIVIDGWFSRPGPFAFLGGEIEPDLAAIEHGLAANELEHADVVFPIHSHYDHAMDAPEVARRTGAVLMGSPSTAMIGRGWGLDEARIRVVEDREEIQIGRFTLVPIESQHFQFTNPEVRERALGDPEITEPLTPPVAPFAYKLGKPYAVWLKHPRGRILIQGSAGYVDGGLAGVEADVVFLGTGGLGSQTDEYREAYWRETVERTGARRIIPVHWDGLTSPIEGPFRGPVRVAALVVGSGLASLPFLQEKAIAEPERRFMTLPRYGPVVLFE
jgi:L-ascorbate metabolism protein UlaG (beta-lactamase superfamily)